MEFKNKKFHTCYIYGLKEKGLSTKIRYIGKTNNLKRRLREHIVEIKKNVNTHKNNWIRLISNRGGEIELVILDVTDSNNWKIKEKFWINKFGIENLTNHYNGSRGGRACGNFLNYESAKKIVHNLKLYSLSDWLKFCKSGNRPKNIPACPEKTYDKKTWKGYADWLNIENKNPKHLSKNFLKFKKARQFIHNINLKSLKEFENWNKTKRPSFIPSDPKTFYKNKGWKGYVDWVGLNKYSYKNKLSYEDAKKLAHNFNIRTMEEWRNFCKLKKFKNIPTNPKRTYEKEWISWRDWLGTNLTNYKTFEESKNFVKNLNLKSRNEWLKYYEDNEIKTIPKYPQNFYKNDGWENWYDWLNKEKS